MSQEISKPKLGQRVLVLQLAARQQRLREAVVSYQEKNDLDLPTMAHRLGLRVPSDAAGIIEKLQPICGGKALTALGQSLGMPALAKEITEIATQVNDRHLGLSFFPDEVINLTFDLIETHRCCGLSMKDFASRFTRYSEVVLGALISSRKSCSELVSMETRREIRNVLETTNWNEVRPQVDPAITQKAVDFLDLYNRLIGKYKLQVNVAKRLGCYDGTIRSALRGESGGKTYDRLIERAKQLLAEKPLVTSVFAPSVKEGGAVVVQKDNDLREVVIATLANLINTAIPLAREALSDSFTIEERKRLRTLTGEEGVFRLSNLLNRLCGEKAKGVMSMEEQQQDLKKRRTS